MGWGSRTYRIGAGLLTLVATVAYTLGLVLPMTTFSTRFLPLIDRTETYTLPSAIQNLFEDGEFLLAGILVLFTFIFPVIKLFSLFMGVLAGWTDESKPLYRWMRATGRWSMLDVFVVAVLVVLLRVEAMGGSVAMVPRLGIYCFGGSVILAIWAGHWAETANRIDVADQHAN